MRYEGGFKSVILKKNWSTPTEWMNFDCFIGISTEYFLKGVHPFTKCQRPRSSYLAAFYYRYLQKFRVKELGKGVKITLGKVKVSDRWEVQNYMFDKETFKPQDQVRQWLETHLKGEIQMLLGFKAWNECRSRLLRAYVQISSVS
jgi:hypothetical protein